MSGDSANSWRYCCKLFRCGRFILEFKVRFIPTFPLTFYWQHVIDIKYEEYRRAHPLPARSSLTSHRPFAQLRLYQTAWFPNLTILMFAMALGIGSSVLFILQSRKILANPNGMRWLAIFYCLSFGVCTLLLMVFISICLALRFNRLRLPSWLKGWKQSFEKLDKKRLIIQRGLWTTLIFSLLMVLAFTIKVFLIASAHRLWFNMCKRMLYQWWVDPRVSITRRRINHPYALHMVRGYRWHCWWVNLLPPDTVTRLDLASSVYLLY